MRKIALVFTLGFVLIGCGRNSKDIRQGLQKPGSGSQIEDSPLQKIEKFSLKGYTEGNKKRWEIEGKSADVLEGVVKIDNVVARTYGEEGELNLQSDSGEYDRQKESLRLKDNVIVTTSEGTRLQTDSLVWNSQKQSIDTNDDVFIEKGNLTCQGKGAFVLPEKKKVKINKDVKVKIKPKTKITSNGPLELDYDKNFAVFYDNVKVEDERGKIFADKVEVQFEPGAKKIIKILASGNVKIVQADNIAYSDEAIYDSILGKVTLKGNPRLVIYPESEAGNLVIQTQ